MEKRAREVPKGVTAIVKRAATSVHRTVVLSSPVDTGELRSNWVGTLNTPFTSIIPPYAPGNKLGIGERANAQGAIAQGQVTIKAFDSRKDVSVIFANNTPQVGLINSGAVRSQQAPMMFVEKSIQFGIVSIKGAKILKD